MTLGCTSAKSITRPLYRNLLRVVKLYACSDDSNMLCSLLHRSGMDDLIDYSRIRISGHAKAKTETATNPSILSKDEAMDLSRSYKDLRESMEGSDDKEEDDEIMENLRLKGSSSSSQTPAHIILYKQLLREIIGLSKHMHFPSEIEQHKRMAHSIHNEPDNMSYRLLKVIRREFRATSEHPSYNFTESARTQAAFLALRELNKKLAWVESLGHSIQTNSDLQKQKQKRRNQIQKARGVTPLPTFCQHPSSYIRPGSYLVAHPLLSGYFSRTVIAILDHTDDTYTYNPDNEPVQQTGGTYGLVVNRPSLFTQQNDSNHSGRARTLSEVIRPNCLPLGLRVAFGDNPIREGGPVNFSLQMMYSATSEQEDKLQIGGTLLPIIESKKYEETSATHTDRAIYYQGDVIKASQSVIDNDMDSDDFSFLIGASCWEDGQLQSEIEKGYWLPCRGPPQIAHTGNCEHDIDDNHDIDNTQKDTEMRPISNLWLSMMCSIGDDEANLAHLLYNAETDENGDACDLV